MHILKCKKKYLCMNTKLTYSEGVEETDKTGGVFSFLIPFLGPK